MRWIILLLLLATCRSASITTNCDIVVLESREIIDNNTTLRTITRDTSLYFSFAGTCTLQPTIYTFGAAKVTVINAHGDQRILANTSSVMHLRFKDPGRQTVMFVWEGRRKFNNPFMVTVEYRP